MKKNLQTALVVTLITAAVQAHAGLIGFSSSGATAFADEGINVGTEFTANQALVVDSLGAYDFLDDGLDVAREVDLWHVPSGTLVASVIVPAGTGPTLDGGFRFASITPVSLISGDAYRVSTVYDTLGSFLDPYSDNATQSPVSNVTLLGGTYFDLSGTATFPNNFDFDTHSAANFTTVSAVPEPSAVVTGLLCLGVAAFGMRRKFLPRSA